MRDGRKTHVSPGRIHESGQAAVPLGGVGGRRAVGELPQAPGNKGIGGLLSLIFSPRWSKSRTIEG